MAKRKAKRVEVECATPAGWRWLKSIVARSEKVSGARMDGEERFTVTDPGRFRQTLQASECRITAELAGARRRRR